MSTDTEDEYFGRHGDHDSRDNYYYNLLMYYDLELFNNSLETALQAEEVKEFIIAVFTIQL